MSQLEHVDVDMTFRSLMAPDKGYFNETDQKLNFLGQAPKGEKCE